MSIIYNNQVVAGKYTQQVVADADTVNAGIIKLATEEQIIEGVDNTTAVTPFYLAQKQDKISAGNGIVIDNNEISCTINPDEQTIVRKDNGTMQCIGQLTKSNTLKFDWEGTQAEYNVAYLNGTIQPDWYCYITDDEEFVDYADVCNQSLSNLRPAGEARFDAKLDKNQITNCLLEIPQNIKLELNDGVLTLKAGSKVIVPNGVGVFDEAVINSDINFTYTYAPPSDTPCMLFIDKQGTRFVSSRIVATCYSGTTKPEGNFRNWYNTAENKMYSIGANATVDGSGFSLPIAIITQGSDGVTKSIDQIFNGMGYIGSTAWVDKGVKGLIPNGRNEDGSLNNVEARTESVLTYTNTSSAGGGRLYSFKTPTNGVWTAIDFKSSDSLNIGTPTSNWYYSETENKWLWQGNELPWFDFAYSTCETSSPYTITSFQPKLPFRAVDYNDLETKVSKSGDTMTGNLTFNKTSPHIMLTDNKKDNTIAPTSADDIYGKIQFRDKNNVWLGGVECKNRTNGNLDLQLFANRTVGDTTKSAAACLSVDSTGKAFFTFPHCVTKPTTISTASSSSVAVVVQNYLNGQSWYRVWSDGFCEQGGVWNYTHNARYMATTITLLKALKTVLYKGATSIDHSSISTVIANCDFTTTSDSGTLTHVALSAERLYTATTSSAGKVYWEVKGFIK